MKEKANACAARQHSIITSRAALRYRPQFVGKSGKVFKMSYPCAMLNVMVAEHNTNPQYTVSTRAGS